MRLSRKGALLTILLGGFLGVVPSRAGQENDCVKDIRKAEQEVTKEIDKHGMFSKQAAKAQRKLDKARTKCWIAQTHKKR
jgi:hypothetical protein